MSSQIKVVVGDMFTSKIAVSELFEHPLNVPTTYMMSLSFKPVVLKVEKADALPWELLLMKIYINLPEARK